jgi:hypothetical protein
VKKSEVEGQSFIVAMPHDADGVVLTVSANAKPPYVDKNIFWIRARELGTETWGQTMWAEVYDQEDGFFVSKEIKPTALWLVPETTYEIEVAPETLRVVDFSLTVQAKGKPVERGDMEKPKLYRNDSLLESPIFWVAVIGLGLAAVLMFVRHGL